jgi:hypothetical protein
MPKEPKWLSDVFSSCDRSTPETVRQQEKRAADRLKPRGEAKTTKGSGRFPFSKGDAESLLDRHECKQTAKKQYTLKRDDLRKIETQALNTGRLPGFIIEFLHHDHFSKGMSKEWIVLPIWVYERLINGE